MPSSESPSARPLLLALVLAGVAAFAASSCASSGSVSAPTPPPTAPEAQPVKTAAERLKEKEAEALSFIDSLNLVYLEPAEWAKRRGLAWAELAKIHFEAGDMIAAIEGMAKAVEEAKPCADQRVIGALDRQQYLILRYAALEAAKHGKVDDSLRLFDKLALLPRLTKGERDQAAGDRLLVIEMRAEQAPGTKDQAFHAALSRLIGPTNQWKPAEGNLPRRPAELEWSPEQLRAAIGEQIGKDVAQAQLPSGDAPVAETGNFDQGIVLRVVSANKKSVSTCYSRSLKDNSAPPRGKLELLVTLEPTGVVSGAEVQSNSLRKSELARCIADAVTRWRFPPFDGNSRQFVLPFLLQAFH